MSCMPCRSRARDAELEDAAVHAQRALLVHAVRPAGKDDAAGGARLEGGDGRGRRDDLQ